MCSLCSLLPHYIGCWHNAQDSKALGWVGSHKTEGAWVPESPYGGELPVNQKYQHCII